MQDINYMPGWTEIGVTYRELAEMPRGQLRLLLITAERCDREGLSAEATIEQMKWALNRPNNRT
jgi:hypothetical protein